MGSGAPHKGCRAFGQSARAAGLAVALAFAATEPAWAAPGAYAPGEILVRFRSQGSHALDACAEAVHERGGSYAAAARDGSDSLDRLHRRFRVRGVRALFRRADGSPLEGQRRRQRERLAAVRERRGLSRTRALPDLSHVYRIELPRAGLVESAVAAYRDDPHVVWAQPNYRVESTALEDGTPNDPFLASAGSWGQPYEDLFGLRRIRAPEAWREARGEGVVVSVNDTGLDYDHPDIAANVWLNPGEDLNGDGVVQDAERNGVDDDANGFVDDFHGFDFHGSSDEDQDGRYDGPLDLVDADPFDDNGHGTHVAGTVAAVADNGIGVVGVAPRARVMATKGLGETGAGTTADLAAGIVYAAENGARVVNNSWSCRSRCPENPIAEEAVRLAHGLGVLLVFSAGNRADEIAFFSPQNMQETLAVGASDPANAVVSFSNRGFDVDVVAPGAGFLEPPPFFGPTSAVLSLRSSISNFSDQLAVGGQYLRLTGTSMAAPHVVGVAALLLSQRPELTPEQLKLALQSSAQDLGPPGRDRAAGAGLVDAAAALALPRVPDLVGELSSPGRFATLRLADGAVQIMGSAGGSDFAHYQLFLGETAEPDAFAPLAPPQTVPVEAGVLAVWQPSEASLGIGVLRLAVTARDGVVLERHVTFSLERNPPQRIGGTPTDDLHPVLSDGRVVFESRYSVSGEDEGANVFVAELGGETHPLAAQPYDERRPTISGKRVAFERWQVGGPSLATCELEDASAGCEPSSVGGSSARSPRLDGDRIAWIAPVNGVLAVHHCELRGAGGCPGAPLAPGARPQLSPSVSGSRFAWTDYLQIRTCELDADTGACPETQLTEMPILPDLPAFSGRLFAWLEFELGFQTQVLRACELDPETGACPPIPLPTNGRPSPPDVDGERIVWADRAEPGNGEVYLCEYDPLTRSCPVQRLTHNPRQQLSPSIDGDTVVWISDRDGADFDVYGLRLPTLAPIGPRRFAEGRPGAIEVSGSDPNGDPLTLGAEGLDQPLVSLGASFQDRGDGSGRLVWTPGYDAAGTHRVRFTLETLGELRTYESIEIEVSDVNRPPQLVVPRFPRAEARAPLVVDACGSADPDGDALRFAWRDLWRRPLGESCQVTLDPPARGRLRIVRVAVSDGQAEQSAWLLARWPRR